MPSDHSEEIAELLDASQLRSVSSDGESTSQDTNAAKARLRDTINDDHEKIARRKTRPVVSSFRIRGCG